MIESMMMPLDSFDLKGFLRAYRRFHHRVYGNTDPACGVSVMRKWNDMPVPLEETKGLRHELLKRKKKVFFQVHEPLADDKARCVDGKRRRSERFDIGMEDGYGFVVEVLGDQIAVHPALYDGSSNFFPRITLQGTCSVLEGCMKDFAGRFVLTK